MAITRPAYILPHYNFQAVDYEDCWIEATYVDVETSWLVKAIGEKGIKVWRYLNNRTNEEGITHAALHVMAKKLKMPERTVSYYLQKLNKCRLAIYDKDRLGIQKLTMQIYTGDPGDPRNYIRCFLRHMRGKYGKMHCSIPHMAYEQIKQLVPHGGKRAGAGRKPTGKVTRKDTRDRTVKPKKHSIVIHVKRKGSDTPKALDEAVCGNQGCGPNREKPKSKSLQGSFSSELLRTASVSEASEPPPHLAVVPSVVVEGKEGKEGKERLASLERPRLTLVRGNPATAFQSPHMDLNPTTPSRVEDLIVSTGKRSLGFGLRFRSKEVQQADRLKRDRIAYAKQKNLIPLTPYQINTVIIPHPPAIPHNAHDNEIARRCLEAYSGVLRKYRDQRCWLDLPKLKKSKLFAKLVTAGKELIRYDIAPYDWVIWSFKMAAQYGNVKTPTMAWVFSIKRIQKNAEWHEPFTIRRRVVTIPIQQEIVVRYKKMIGILGTTGNWLKAMEEAFPSGTEYEFDKMVARGSAEAAALQKNFNERAQDGECLW